MNGPGKRNTLRRILVTGLACLTLPVLAVSAGAQPVSQSGVAPRTDRATAGINTAPYFDITRKAPTLPEIAEATGQKHFTLAFVLGTNAGCEPTWGGEIPVDAPRIVDQVKRLREMGGEVVVASGGAQGPYLENICGNAEELRAAYTKVLDVVGANHLDIDVEASIPQDMVNEALAALQKRRQTKVSYTLRVQGDETGVDPYSYEVLRSAAGHGVDVLVNPMAMEFGSDKPWGQAVIAAAESTLGQMKKIWPNLSDAELRSKLGVTPMIGRNYNGNIFDQQNAKKLVEWANTNQIGLLSFWSAGRDNGGCPGGAVAPDCSSIEQSRYEFTDIFHGFSAE